MSPPLEPRTTTVSIPLPEDAGLPPAVRQRLAQLPPLNNLRMFTAVPQCFLPVTDLIDALFNHGTVDAKLRQYMYLRIAIKYGLFYEYRHNILFCRQIGMTEAEIEALKSDGPVDGLDQIGNLVCAAAEDITANLSIGDETLKSLMAHFDRAQTCEIIILVSWFNMLIRYVESTRVPYEDDPAAIIAGGAPLKIK